MLTVETVRQYLRFSATTHDDEIRATMDAALMDLERAGMPAPTEAPDPLADQAVKLYARWQFDFAGRGPEYERAYKDLRAGLALRRPDEEAQVSE